jgi:hypothetical protein
VVCPARTQTVLNGCTMPRDSSTATSAFRILDAATIFMAFVIFPMFLMARIRCLTTHGEWVNVCYTGKQGTLQTCLVRGMANLARLKAAVASRRSCQRV